MKTELELQNIDRRRSVHPVTSLSAHDKRAATIFRAGDGMILEDASGKRILDGFSGLWCVNAGYGQKKIIDAMREQAERLPYATSFFHYANEPSILLAEKLAEISPPGLERAFFTLGGSDAVDSAAKFARYYHSALGAPKRVNFVALKRGYHGSTYVGAGLTGLPMYHTHFGLPLTFEHHISSPYPYRNPAGPDPEAIIAASVDELDAKINEIGADSVAAFICEPIQGSGGIIVPPEGWMSAMQEVCRRYGVLFIADEVITGFGRTGVMFACETERVTPDMMTIAKGLTSGYAPMGAVLMSDAVYDALVAGAPTGAPFAHGFTYTGHPVSAAAALAAIALYEGGLLAQGREVGEYFQQQLRSLLDHPWVGDVRGRGMLAAIELVAEKGDRTPFEPSRGIGQKILAAGYAVGLLFRAFAGDVIGFAPPLCATRNDIDLLMERFNKALNAVYSKEH